MPLAASDRNRRHRSRLIVSASRNGAAASQRLSC
jgi:hypothetical protein